MIFEQAHVVVLAATIGLALDGRFGEPDALWRRAPHPAVLMGRAVAALDHALNRGERRQLRGAIALGLLVGVAGALGALIQWGGLIAKSLACAALFAQRSLAEHVSAVADGLDEGLDEGRAAVSMIVGRDPETLDEAGVARAAVESAAENFSDGVVAPLFWFLLAGAPGLLIYKAVNTADSMVGHRTPRHEAFGWASARFDDLLNLLPARLSGLLLASTSRAARRALGTMWRDARNHRSPNAGWPEAATAGALGLALAGPRVYGGVRLDAPYLNAAGRRDANAEDIRRAVALLWRCWTWSLLIPLSAAAATLFIAWGEATG